MFFLERGLTIAVVAISHLEVLKVIILRARVCLRFVFSTLAILSHFLRQLRVFCEHLLALSFLLLLFYFFLFTLLPFFLSPLLLLLSLFLLPLAEFLGCLWDLVKLTTPRQSQRVGYCDFLA